MVPLTLSHTQTHTRTRTETHTQQRRHILKVVPRDKKHVGIAKQKEFLYTCKHILSAKRRQALHEIQRLIHITQTANFGPH